MDAIRFRSARGALLLLAAWLLLAAVPDLAVAGRRKLADGPVVWYEKDRSDIPQPRERHPNLYKDMMVGSVTGPIGRTLYPPRQIRNLGVLFGGDHVLPAANVNALDEVPNCSWFTNRIGLFPVDPADAARGPCIGTGPDRSGPWRVIAAKTEGVTPGFTIQDPAGQRWLIKFDPPDYPGMTSAAGVISGRIMHAAGYNVPMDTIVQFRAGDLYFDGEVSYLAKDGTERTLTREYLDRMLADVACSRDGRYRALASRFLDGTPIGPFNFEETRSDDPNDRIRHEDRRELRGLRVFCAWLSHFDTKQHNTLDLYVEQDGRRFVKHYLIDFASSLGSGAAGPAARFSNEYTFSIVAIGGRLFSLGLHENDWRRLQRPEGLDEIGYFTSEYFDPREYRPLQSNPAFANRTDRDGYWAAKIISAFTDEHLAAIVAEGGYCNPDAAAYMSRTLAERRDIIARCYFDRIAPLDFFRVEDGRIVFQDLGVERGIYPAAASRYRARVAACDAGRDRREPSEWRELAELAVDPSEAPVTAGAPFVAVECQVDRGEGWSDSIFAYAVPAAGRVVAVDR